MAITTIIENKDKQDKLQEERKEEEKLQLQSEAIAKLYKNKKQIDNSKNAQF